MAFQVLSKEVADATTRTGSPLASALMAYKNKGGAAGKGQSSGSDRLQATTLRIDLLTSSIVSKALLSGFAVDSEVVRLDLAPNCSFLIVTCSHLLSSISGLHDTLVPRFAFVLR